MTITTIIRTSADLVPVEAGFNAILDTGNPCDELAELQEQYDAAAAMDPPPKGVAGLAARIRAKQRECDAYNPAPASSQSGTRQEPAETKPEDSPQKPKLSPKLQAIKDCPECFDN